jgi:hypothetical protein
LEPAIHDKHFIPSHVAHYSEGFIFLHSTQENPDASLTTYLSIAEVTHVTAVPIFFTHPSAAFIAGSLSIHI